MDLQSLSFPIRRPRRRRVENGREATSDINHTPYYRATRSRRADSQRATPFSPLRVAPLLPRSSCRFRAAFLRACLRARRVPPRFHLSRFPLSTQCARAHSRGSHTNANSNTEHCSCIETRDRDPTRDFAVRRESSAVSNCKWRRWAFRRER